jgi:hypothetical protein
VQVEIWEVYMNALLREEISDFERGKRVPPLPVLLQYARIVGVYMDAIVDDDLDFPGSVAKIKASNSSDHKIPSASRAAHGALKS